MGVLTEFVRSEAAHLRGEIGKRDVELSNWKTAIQRLNEMLKDWVVEADSGHNLLATSPTIEYTRQEATFGVYSITGISITLGGRLNGRAADVVPRARYVAATIIPPGEQLKRADGLVEIKDGSVAEFYLFRLAGADSGNDRWFIRSVNEWNAESQDRSVDELTRDLFEKAILRILK